MDRPLPPPRRHPVWWDSLTRWHAIVTDAAIVAMARAGVSSGGRPPSPLEYTRLADPGMGDGA